MDQDEDGMLSDSASDIPALSMGSRPPSATVGMAESGRSSRAQHSLFLLLNAWSSSNTRDRLGHPLSGVWSSVCLVRNSTTMFPRFRRLMCESPAGRRYYTTCIPASLNMRHSSAPVASCGLKSYGRTRRRTTIVPA